jgi:hypothetical protein
MASNNNKQAPVDENKIHIDISDSEEEKRVQDMIINKVKSKIYGETQLKMYYKKEETYSEKGIWSFCHVAVIILFIIYAFYALSRWGSILAINTTYVDS